MNSSTNRIPQKLGLAALTLAVTVLVSVSQAQATPVTPVTLTDLNSVAKVDVNSSAGMYQWTVGGVSQLAQQWFWYRIDNSPYAQPINTVSPAVWDQLAGANSLNTVYNNAQVGFQIKYTLTGGTGGDSDIIESISAKNNTASPMNLHFFQYSDFDLAGSPLGDSVAISGDPVNGFFQATQTKLASQLSETVTLPNATRASAAYAGAILAGLASAGYNLDNVQAAGPGDVTWAFQWDFTVDPGATVDIFKDKRLDLSPVPEPSVLGFATLGLAALLLRQRRRV